MFRIFTSRTFRQGSVATMITVLGVVMIIVLTMVLSTLSTRLDWTLDLTPDSIFQISDETRDFLEGLTTDVNIYVLNTEDAFVSSSPREYMLQANEVIRRYGLLSPRVNVHYIDILRDPVFAAAYAELDLRPNQILVVNPHTGNHRVIGHLDLFNIQTGQGGMFVTSSRAEQVMTSAILNVTTETQIRVTVLGGYNNGDISAFTAMLEANNYEIVHQNLMVEEIDPEATVALLVTPQRDLGEESLRRIDRFLNNDNQFGRTLFYIASADQTPMSQMPNLSAWLEEWGIGVGESVVFETDLMRLLALGDLSLAIVDYAEDEFSAQMRQRQLFPAIMHSRPLVIMHEHRNARATQTLLQFSEMSGIRPMDRQITEADITGPHPTLVLSTEMRWDGLTPMRSHVLVSGSHHSLDSIFLGHVNYANGDYFLTVLDSLAGREDTTVRIRDRTISITMMPMTLAQMNAIAAAVLIILPLSLLNFGILVWWRRRHK